MEVIKTSSYEELSEKTADIVLAVLKGKPDLVLGLASGSTPVGLYELLVLAHKKGEADFSQVHTFHLDEYVGLATNHKQSYRHFFEKHLLSKVNIPEANTHFLDGGAKDPERECERYEQEIKDAGGIDVQILGIGQNGHIAFNEPGSPRDSRTRVVDLDAQTIKSNSRFFDSIDEVPRQAITMGIATILEAKHIILLAAKNKKDIVEKALEANPSPTIPASLTKTHDDIVWIVEG